jgi:hypothetical protein
LRVTFKKKKKNELLFLVRLSVSACSQFHQVVQLLAFTTVLLSHPTPTRTFLVLHSAPSPLLSSVYLTTNFVQRGYNQLLSCTRICGSLQNRYCVLLSWQICRFTLLNMGQLHSSTGRQQIEVLCPLHVWQILAFPDACSSLCGSFYCIIFGKVADTLRQR